ncbi:MAG: hypothetical protein CM15mP49_33080 [Actinomycetota bacterium]|nr:MAG: hypothetical protein CM15mP49_33080 [Actinomycetota bacterium]
MKSKGTCARIEGKGVSVMFIDFTDEQKGLRKSFRVTTRILLPLKFTNCRNLREREKGLFGESFFEQLGKTVLGCYGFGPKGKFWGQGKKRY